MAMLLTALAMMIASISSVDGFIPLKQPQQLMPVHPTSLLTTVLHGFPRAIHTEFTVEKATPEMMESLGVNKWPTWGTEGSAKYKTGIKSPEKWYDCNELSYIISGSMEITPKATGIPVLVQAGDFVTFPDGFGCYWFVIEPVVKHYYLY
jgi:uncharacterized cupin superfamily protein